MSFLRPSPTATLSFVILSCALSSALSSGVLCAQRNLAANGDFERSATSFAPWKFSAASIPRLTSSGIKQGKIGHSNDRLLEWSVDASPSKSGDVSLEQTVQLPGAGLYQISFSVRVMQKKSTSGVKATKYESDLSLSLASSTLKFRVSDPALIRSQGQTFFAQAGSVILRVRATPVITSNTSVGVARFTYQIDDVVVRPVANPQIASFHMQNAAGKRVSLFQVRATPNVPIVVFGALQRLSKPLTIPGFRGGLELDPFRDGGLLHMLVTRSSALGRASYTIKPADLNILATMGHPFYMQIVEASLNPRVLSLGSRLGLPVR